MTNNTIEDVLKREQDAYGYAGKPKAWQEGFDKGFNEAWQAAQANTQEPVAWASKSNKELFGMGGGYITASLIKTNRDCYPLYTSPPNQDAEIAILRAAFNSINDMCWNAKGHRKTEITIDKVLTVIERALKESETR